MSETVESILRQEAPRIQAALRAEAIRRFAKRTGKLSRGFLIRIRKDNFGNPWGVAFTLPRYGYILNHGTKGGTGNRKYSTSAIPRTDFITKTMEPLVNHLADRLARETADRIMKITY